MKEQIRKDNVTVNENEGTNMEETNMKEQTKESTPFWKKAVLACGCTLAVILSLRGCGNFNVNSADEVQPQVLAATDDNTAGDDLQTQTAYVDRIVEVTASDETPEVRTVVVPSEPEVITVEVPGETRVVTNTVEVPGATRTITNTVEVPVYVDREVAHVYEITNTVKNDDGTYTVTFTCTKCDDSYTLTFGEEEEAHKHAFEVVSHKDATCTEKGLDVYACECGATYEEELKALGHSWGEWIVTSEATESANAVETRTCEVCNETESREVDGSQIEKHEHSYKETARVEATCETDGYVEYTCDCGDTYRDVIKATGHNFVVVPGTAVEPTETEAGKNADQKCENCDKVVTGDEIEKLPAKHEHSYTETITKEATCTEDGEKTFTCECGDTYTEVIKATGHNFGDWVYNNDATEEADGTETRVCGNCGETETRVAEGTKLEPAVNWAAATRVEFNEYGWGFYTNLNGEDICTTRGAYRQYLTENYPQLTVCEDDIAVWAE